MTIVLSSFCASDPVIATVSPAARVSVTLCCDDPDAADRDIQHVVRAYHIAVRIGFGAVNHEHEYRFHALLCVYIETRRGVYLAQSGERG